VAVGQAVETLRHNVLASWRQKAPQSNPRACTVRAEGPKVGFVLIVASTESPASARGNQGDYEVFGAVRAGLCCRRAQADSDRFGRRSRYLWFRDQNASPGDALLAASACRGSAQKETERRARNDRLRGVPVFMCGCRIQRAMWRSRQARSASAGGAHGDLVQGVSCRRKRIVRPTGRQRLVGQTAWGGPLANVRRPVPRRSPAFTGWRKKRHWPAGGSSLRVRVVGRWHGRQRFDPQLQVDR